MVRWGIALALLLTVLAPLTARAQSATPAPTATPTARFELAERLAVVDFTPITERWPTAFVSAAAWHTPDEDGVNITVNPVGTIVIGIADSNDAAVAIVAGVLNDALANYPNVPYPDISGGHGVANIFLPGRYYRYEVIGSAVVEGFSDYSADNNLAKDFSYNLEQLGVTLLQQTLSPSPPATVTPSPTIALPPADTTATAANCRQTIGGGCLGETD